MLKWACLAKASISSTKGRRGLGWSAVRISLKFTVVPCIQSAVMQVKHATLTVVLLDFVPDATCDMLYSQECQ